MRITVQKCGKCPFNYDTIWCVAVDGEYGSRERTIAVVKTGFPAGCPLLNKPITIHAGKKVT